MATSGGRPAKGLRGIAEVCGVVCLRFDEWNAYLLLSHELHKQELITFKNSIPQVLRHKRFWQTRTGGGKQDCLQLLLYTHTTNTWECTERLTVVVSNLGT